MHLPPQKGQESPPSVLPRRREALEEPGAAWDLLDAFHHLPGVRGSAVATRMGRVVLSDVAIAADRPFLEEVARYMAHDLRDVVGRLGMGPLRQAAIQAKQSTIAAAPIGPGMLVSVADSDVPLAQIRHSISCIQDELGRVELSIGSRGNGRPDLGPMRRGAPVLDAPPVVVSSAPPPEAVAIDEMQPTEIVDERGVVMVFIPGGRFRMGSEESDDERPVHEAVLRPFLIDKYPVTNEAYAAFLEEATVWRPSAANLLLDEDYLAHWGGGRPPDVLSQHPVVWVSWWQAAKGYCAWRGGRLPTEAEWEFAGRGTDGRVYPWGNTWRNLRCNHYRLGAHWTSPVGEFPEGRSPFGVMDLSGNVWEWCADWYASDWYRRSPRENPVGPAYGRGRVIRGGSRFNHAGYVKLTKRLFFPPHHSDVSIGFRCVKPWPPQPLAEKGVP